MIRDTLHKPNHRFQVKFPISEKHLFDAQRFDAVFVGLLFVHDMPNYAGKILIRSIHSFVDSGI